MLPAFLLAMVATSVPVRAANGVATLEIEQNRATAGIELPGGLKVDLELRFEKVLGLSAESLGISARVVDPTDLALIARLPASAGIPVGFPVMVVIEPPASGALAFSGVVAIDLHTHNLAFTANSPLRLFAAHAGQGFRDITASTGLGSYRTGANKGGFSEFLIVADLRAVDTVIAEKFGRLEAKLDEAASSTPSALLTSLRTGLAAARNAHLANDAVTAVERIQQFAELVRQNSGTAIHDVWRSSRDVDNLAGELREGAATLKFSLLCKSSGGS